MNPVLIGSDHAGFSLKKAVIEHFAQAGLSLEDCGTYSEASADYPDIAKKVCAAVLERQCQGILICGTGTGMCITANRFRGIRAASCCLEFQARAARQHNNANVICLGERVTAPGLAFELVKIFLETPFEGGRHERRVNLIDANPNSK